MTLSYTVVTRTWTHTDTTILRQWLRQSRYLYRDTHTLILTVALTLRHTLSNMVKPVTLHKTGLVFLLMVIQGSTLLKILLEFIRERKGILYVFEGKQKYSPLPCHWRLDRWLGQPLILMSRPTLVSSPCCCLVFSLTGCESLGIDNWILLLFAHIMESGTSSAYWNRWLCYMDWAGWRWCILFVLVCAFGFFGDITKFLLYTCNHQMKIPILKPIFEHISIISNQTSEFS